MNLQLKKENYQQMIDRWYDHAKLRAMERYALHFDSVVHRNIQEDYRKKVFNELLKIPNSDRVVLRGRVSDIVVTMIFATKHNVVVTFLHNNWVSTDTDEFYIMSKFKRKFKGHTKRTIKAGCNMRIHSSNNIRKLKAPPDRDFLARQEAMFWHDEENDL